MTPKHDEDFYYLNYFHLFRTKNKLKKQYNVSKNHDYCYVKMPKEYNKILKYNYGEKSTKVLFIIYADLKSLFEKVNTCHNNHKTSSTTKINKHTPSGYLSFTHCSLDTTKIKLNYYRGKNCMKNFCLDLREQATKLKKKKKMMSLTNEEKKIHREQKVCFRCKKRI